MTDWLEPLLANAIFATVLALIVAIVARFRPRPVVMHALWLIVLLKFITPPVIRIEPLWTGWSPIGNTERNSASVRNDLSLSSSDRDVNGKPVGVDETALTSSGQHDDAMLEVGIDRASEWRKQSDSPPAQPSETAGQWTGLTRLTRSLSDWHLVRTPSWLPAIIAAIWACGSVTWFALAAIRLARFRRTLGRTRLASDSLQRVAHDIADRLGLRSRAIVRLTDANVSPMLTTFRRQGVVLLPNALLGDLSERQQASIIAHELAHFRRRDHWVRWLEFVVVGVYWWHPVVWLARRQLQQAEESCCDAWVLNVFPDQGRGYAQALMATVDFLSEVRTPAPAGACGFGQVHSLRRRLEMILKRTWRPELSTLSRITLLTVALGVLTWTPRAFSQTAPPAAPPANATIELELVASSPAAPVVAPAAQELPVPAAAPPAIVSAPAVQAARPSTEERLDRLEAMLNRLIAEMGNQTNPQTALQPVTPPPALPRSGVTSLSGSRGVSVPQNNVQADPTPKPPPQSPFGRTRAGVRPPTSGGSIEEIRARLVEMEFEIKSLELQLQRAQAQRELLQRQLKSSSDGGSSQVTPPASTTPVAPVEAALPPAAPASTK